MGTAAAYWMMFVNVTLGLSRNQSVGESKVIRLLSIIHHGIILDLVCGFSGSSVGLGCFVLISSRRGGKSLSFCHEMWLGRGPGTFSEMRLIASAHCPVD